MSIEGRNPLKDTSAKEGIFFDCEINSNSDVYSYSNDNWQITYGDNSGNSTVVAPVTQHVEYSYSSYAPNHTTVKINTNELLEIKFNIFDDLSPSGRIHKLSEYIKKLRESI